MIESKVEEPDPIATAGVWNADARSRVSSNLRNKLRKSIRRPSLAGDGLPERMRSTAVAFLGLTAAAGLALVAIFSQLGFPLLTPAPLPSAPAAQGSVGNAVQLGNVSPVAAIAQARSAPAVSSTAAGPGASRTATHGKRDVGAVDHSAVPVSTPPSTDSPVASEPAPAPEATPTPAPVAATVTGEPAPAPVATPVSSPGTGEKPSTSKPVTSKPDVPESEPAEPEPTPEPPRHGKKPEKPKPTPPPSPKPPNSGKPEAAPAPEPSYVPAPAPTGDEKAKGKEKKGK